MRPLFTICYANLNTRIVLLILHLMNLLDTIIFILTLSFVTSDFYVRVLFSEWAEKMAGPK